MHVGQMIQSERRSQKLSVAFVAEAVAVSVGTIRAIEQGRRNPSAQVMTKLHSYFNLGGKWISNHEWVDDDGIKHLFNEFDGAPLRKNRPSKPDGTVVETADVDTSVLLVNVMRMLLDADADTLKSIQHFLNR